MAAPIEPTPDEVEKAFSDLLEGRTSRRQAADWAAQWVAAEDPRVETRRTWKALTELAMADSPTIDRPYLYGEDDFAAWLEEFKSGAPFSEARERAWNQLRFLFDTDDGSLPEIWILNLAPSDIEAIAALLENLAGEIGGSPPQHVVLGGIQIAEVTIPDLGMFRGDAEIILDYRMGEGWNADSLAALFELLRRIRSTAPDARFDLEPHALIRVRRLFIQNVESYMAALK